MRPVVIVIATEVHMVRVALTHKPMKPMAGVWVCAG